MTQLSRTNEKYVPLCEFIIFRSTIPFLKQSTSRESKTGSCFQEWDQNIGNKYTTFTATSYAIINGYRDVLT